MSVSVGSDLAVWWPVSQTHKARVWGTSSASSAPLPRLFSTQEGCAQMKEKSRMCISLKCFSSYRTYWTYLFLPQCRNCYINGNPQECNWLCAYMTAHPARYLQLKIRRPLAGQWNALNVWQHKEKHFYNSIILIPPLIYRCFKMCFDKSVGGFFFLPDNCWVSFAPSKIYVVVGETILSKNTFTAHTPTTKKTAYPSGGTPNESMWLRLCFVLWPQHTRIKGEWDEKLASLSRHGAQRGKKKKQEEDINLWLWVAWLKRDHRHKDDSRQQLWQNCNKIFAPFKAALQWEQLWILHAAKAISSPEETHGTPCAWNQSHLKICYRWLNTLSTHAHTHTLLFASILVRTLEDLKHFAAPNHNPDLTLNPVLTLT